jgi:hypothetical protein
MTEENKIAEEELDEEKEKRVKVTIPHQKIKGVVPQKKIPKQVFNKKPMTRSAGRGR